MRLLGLLSFYDERPEDLVLYVASLTKAGVDHLVAVDGAYALYPDGKGSSEPNQRAALVMACDQAGIGLTLHTPTGAWAGNEAEKRGTLFALAWAAAEDGDWFFVLDTDELVRDVPADLKARLAGAEHDAAEVTVCDTVAMEANKPNWPTHFRQRRLFRAQPIHLKTSHAGYFRADGSWLGLDPLDEPCLKLGADLTVWHVPQRRRADRQKAKAAYYGRRDRDGMECGPCHRCGGQAVERTESNWRWSEGGPIADIVELCGGCIGAVRKESRRQLRDMGVKPDSVRVAHRYGKAPA
jgi:hypothetical protein